MRWSQLLETDFDDDDDENGDDAHLNGVSSDLHLLWESNEAGQRLAVETLRAAEVPQDLTKETAISVDDDDDDDDDNDDGDGNCFKVKMSAIP